MASSALRVCNWVYSHARARHRGHWNIAEPTGASTTTTGASTAATTTTRGPRASCAASAVPASCVVVVVVRVRVVVRKAPATGRIVLGD
jgi:hypothetical protein